MESIIIGTIGFITFTAMIGRAIGFKRVAQHPIKFDLAVSFLAFTFFAGTSTAGIVGSSVTALLVTVFTICWKAWWVWNAKRGYLSPLDQDSEEWIKAKELARRARAGLNAALEGL